jgi:hypothetical protein
LEDRLRTKSLNEGVPLVRLRKIVAFDRFLARLLLQQPNEWVLKGGFALQLRLGERARTTKDIDLMALSHQQDIRESLRNAGNLDLGDWFQIEVAPGTWRLPGDFGGMRFHLQARLDGRRFENFRLDIGVGDPLVAPVEYLKTPALMEFADIQPTIVPCYPVVQQIAEKVHALTRAHPSGESTRVKDLVDILLMAEMGEIDAVNLILALEATFGARQTHALPAGLPDPPRDWPRPFRSMADEVGLGYTALDEANEAVQRFLDPILGRKAKGSWDPGRWSWQ